MQPVLHSRMSTTSQLSTTYLRFEVLIAHDFEELSMAPIYETQTGALPVPSVGSPKPSLGSQK